MLSVLDWNRTRNTPTEIIVLLYFRNSYEVRFLFWFSDGQKKRNVMLYRLVFRAEEPITCASLIIIVFLAYYNEVHLIFAHLVSKSIAR
jgi:hypothetical protein